MLLEQSFKSFLDISWLRTRQFRDRGFFLALSLFSLALLLLCLCFMLTFPVALMRNLMDQVGVVAEINFIAIFYWTVAGLALSVVASFMAWPWALATAVVLEQEKGLWPQIAKKFISWLASIPLIVFVYIFIHYLAYNALNTFKGLWLYSFASVNWATQLLAFASTLFIYPLLLFIPGTDGVTVDQFFRGALTTVINLGEVGLTVTILCLGLMFLILPRMVYEMQKMLRESGDLQSLEVVRSLGGTMWESLHISLIHSMRSRFLYILVRFVRYSFFEGLMIYALLKYIFSSDSVIDTFFATTIGAQMVKQLVNTQLNWNDLLGLGAWLLIIYCIFIKIESHLLKRGFQ